MQCNVIICLAFLTNKMREKNCRTVTTNSEIFKYFINTNNMDGCVSMYAYIYNHNYMYGSIENES